MFFLNNIDCTNCNEEMRIDFFDKKNKMIKYKCSCGDTLECAFELTGMDKSDKIFSLNETGLLTYKCSCNYSVRDYLSTSHDRSSKILARAYSRKCKKCSGVDTELESKKEA